MDIFCGCVKAIILARPKLHQKAIKALLEHINPYAENALGERRLRWTEGFFVDKNCAE